MEPAATIIRRLGGEKHVAYVTGTAYTAPYRWQYPRERGGTGGLIPQRHHATLIACARERRIRLSADDFMPRAERSS
jgi:hypothetical protein